MVTLKSEQLFSCGNDDVATLEVSDRGREATVQLRQLRLGSTEDDCQDKVQQNVSAEDRVSWLCAYNLAKYAKKSYLNYGPSGKGKLFLKLGKMAQEQCLVNRRFLPF